MLSSHEMFMTQSSVCFSHGFGYNGGEYLPNCVPRAMGCGEGMQYSPVPAIYILILASIL